MELLYYNCCQLVYSGLETFNLFYAAKILKLCPEQNTEGGAMLLHGGLTQGPGALRLIPSGGVFVGMTEKYMGRNSS